MKMTKMSNRICRGKDIESNKWVYGYYVAVPDEYTHGKEIVHAIFDLAESEHVCAGEYKDYGWHEVNPDTVCGCTGIADKNGNMIFERDILHGPWNWTYPEEEYFDIFWRDYDAGYWCHCFRPHEVEVVGNEVDSPGLLAHLHTRGTLDDYVNIIKFYDDNCVGCNKCCGPYSEGSDGCHKWNKVLDEKRKAMKE